MPIFKTIIIGFKLKSYLKRLTKVREDFRRFCKNVEETIQEKEKKKEFLKYQLGCSEKAQTLIKEIGLIIKKYQKDANIRKEELRNINIEVDKLESESIQTMEKINELT